MSRASDRRRGRRLAKSAAPKSPPPPGDRLVFRSGIVLLLALVAGVFWQTGSFEILNFDDDQYLDPLVRQGLTWPGFVRAWTEGQVGNWHPLTTLSFMLDAELFGEWWGGYHLHNVVLHAFASAFLFAALARLTGATGRSLVAAAVFAIHPLRAESVAWITERKDVLSGLFLATTLLAYAFFVEKPASRRRSAALLASFTAGLLSKSILVTLPLGLLILDWWPLGRLAPRPEWLGGGPPRAGVPQRSLRELVVEKLPLLALASASAVATVLSVGDVVRPISTLPFLVRASSSVVAYASYVIQLFAPVGLAPHYPYSSTGPTAGQVAASAAFVATLTAVACLGRRGWPSFTAGWAWYVVSLLPVIGFIPGGIQLIADRYTYVSQIWLVVAFVWGLADLTTRLRAPRQAGRAAAVACVVGLAAACWAQTRVWRDSETLWRHTLAVTDGNAYAHASLASVLAQKNEPVEAAEHNRLALAIEGDNLIALSNMGTLLVEHGGLPEAIRLYERSVEVNPKFAFGWFNLGSALQKTGRVAEAEAAWRRAAELDPALAAAWNNLALIEMDRGDWAEAARLAELAERTGAAATAATTLGRALEKLGRPDEATAAYRRAVAADPRALPALNNLGSMLERTGRLDEAATTFRRALAIEPASPLPTFNLAVVLEQQGARSDAAARFQEAEGLFRKAGNEEMARAAAARAANLAGPPTAAP